MKKSLFVVCLALSTSLTIQAQDKMGSRERGAARIAELAEDLELSNEQMPAIESIVLGTATNLGKTSDEAQVIVSKITQVLQEEEAQMRAVLRPDQLKKYLEEQQQKKKLLRDLFGVSEIQKSKSQKTQSTIKSK